jgi:hypothetical protein
VCQRRVSPCGRRRDQEGISWVNEWRLRAHLQRNRFPRVSPAAPVDRVDVPMSTRLEKRSHLRRGAIASTSLPFAMEGTIMSTADSTLEILAGEIAQSVAAKVDSEAHGPRRAAPAVEEKPVQPGDAAKSCACSSEAAQPSKRTKSDLVHLRSLPSAEPATSTGRVAWIWPEIEAALATGKKLREV